MARYTFGDDERAVRRLRLVSEAYRPTSRDFLSEHAPGAVAVALALDLGCGPGFSTRLVAEACRPRALIGIDASAAFLHRARSTVPEATFEVLDLTDPELRLPAADVIYARLVLAHLPDPLELVTRWRQALADDGVLLVEDLDHVVAPAGPLRRYEAVSSSMVRSGGGVMYGGKALEPLGGCLAAVEAPAALAAEIYLSNVRRWLAAPAAAAHDDLARLAADLEVLRGDGAGGAVTWVVRQLALAKVG